MPGIFPIIIAIGAFAFIAKKKKKRGYQEPSQSPGSNAGNPSLPYHPGNLDLHVTAVPSPSGEINPQGTIGEVCGPISERRQGIWSAYDKSGRCVVFWNLNSNEIMKQYIIEEFQKIGASKNKACASDVWEQDPFSKMLDDGKWIPNPTKMKVLKNALKRAYPQIPEDQLPPKESMPYYVHMVWRFSEAIYMREICGYIPVT